ncbi:ROK family protein [Clostridium lacusfryxellense]|uniref:ROK family protein n=1 Tax=Clostridium lacusfryxellense TaxID=205328 RepID=UPI001C0DE230|nr:ROK family protein [Clostridium lacusfryxellense]MBU3113326.1 ROK family protein [Clostridium lacusfryxellense]
MKYYLGVDLGGTNIAAGVVDENFNIIAKDSIPTNAGRSIDEIVSDMAHLSKKVACIANVPLDQFTSWGIGMPSYVNPKTHLLVHANNLGWKNIPIYSYLKKYIDLPTYIENDANCAALGETLAGIAREYDNAVMLTLGTGVGGGIIQNKRIYAGSDLMGAELGHTKLVYNGELCTCGQRGCLESYCSATALINQAKRKLEISKKSLLYDMCSGDVEQINAKMIFDANNMGDELAQEVVRQYIDYLAAGISTFITIFRSEVIILGGGVAGAGKALFEPLSAKVAENTFAAAEIGVPPVVKSALENDAGIIGAALLEKYAQMR